MGIETAAAIVAPIVVGAISKAMSSSGEGDVKSAQAGKTAAMQKSAQNYQNYRPEYNRANMNAMRGQSTAYQGSANLLSTIIPGSGKAPAGLNYNPLGDMFPQNKVAPPPGQMPHATMGNPAGPGPASLNKANPYVDGGASPNIPRPMDDALKIRAALGDYQPGNVAPTVGPRPMAPNNSPLGPGPMPNPLTAAMQRLR